MANNRDGSFLGTSGDDGLGDIANEAEAGMEDGAGGAAKSRKNVKGKAKKSISMSGIGNVDENEDDPFRSATADFAQDTADADTNAR